MKPRRVILTVEVETDIPVKALTDRHRYRVTVGYAYAGDVEKWAYPLIVKQVSANVIRETKKKGRTR